MRTDTHVLVTLMGCTCVFLGCLYYFSGIYGGQLLKVKLVKLMGFDLQTNNSIRNHTHNSKLLPWKRLTHDWVKVPNSTDLFVYSAYKEWNQIRIIGTCLQKQSTENPLFCNMWYYIVKEMMKISTTRARHVIIPDTIGKRYTACFFLCPLPNNIEDPIFISPLMINISSSPTQPVILLNNTAADLPLLPVYVQPNNSGVKRTFSICIPPMFKISNFKELIEWIELTMLLGVEHFTFYNESMSKITEQVLSYYSIRGLAEVLPWQLPTELKKKSHYHDQLAAINDCLYRNRNLTEYLAFNDFDEYIIPRDQDTTTWADMMSKLKYGNSYSFRNTYFWRKWASKGNTSKDNHSDNLLTMSVLKHANYTFPNRKRSKVIIRPEKVEIMHIHFVARNVSGVEETSNGVDINIGLLHHYRNGQSDHSPVEDKTMLKYRTALIERVKTFWSKFENDPTRKG